MKPHDIDWGPVVDFVLNTRLPDWDKEAVILGAEAASSRYLEMDTEEWRVEHTERFGDDPFSYKIDIELVRRSDGQRKVVDWKSRKTGKLDDRWELRETRSPQKRLYAGALAALHGIDIFPIQYEVRGIMLDGSDKPQQRIITSIICAAEANEAVRHLREQSRLRDTLIQIAEVPWIKSDSGCRIYGEAYKCEFEPACWSGNVRPVPTDLEQITKPLSHSSAKEFLRCPERYRALKSLNRTDEDKDPEDPSAAGHVFHSCMEMIYQQAQMFGNS